MSVNQAKPAFGTMDQNKKQLAAERDCAA